MDNDAPMDGGNPWDVHAGQYAGSYGPTSEFEVPNASGSRNPDEPTYEYPAWIPPSVGSSSTFLHADAPGAPFYPGGFGNVPPPMFPPWSNPSSNFTLHNPALVNNPGDFQQGFVLPPWSPNSSQALPAPSPNLGFQQALLSPLIPNIGSSSLIPRAGQPSTPSVSDDPLPNDMETDAEPPTQTPVITPPPLASTHNLHQAQPQASVQQDGAPETSQNQGTSSSSTESHQARPTPKVRRAADDRDPPFLRTKTIVREAPSLELRQQLGRERKALKFSTVELQKYQKELEKERREKELLKTQFDTLQGEIMELKKILPGRVAENATMPSQAVESMDVLAGAQPAPDDEDSVSDMLLIDLGGGPANGLQDPKGKGKARADPQIEDEDMDPSFAGALPGAFEISTERNIASTSGTQLPIPDTNTQSASTSGTIPPGSSSQPTFFSSTGPPTMLSLGSYQQRPNPSSSGGGPPASTLEQVFIHPPMPPTSRRTGANQIRGQLRIPSATEQIAAKAQYDSQLNRAQIRPQHSLNQATSSVPSSSTPRTTGPPVNGSIESSIGHLTDKVDVIAGEMLTMGAAVQSLLQGQTLQPRRARYERKEFAEERFVKRATADEHDFQTMVRLDTQTTFGIKFDHQIYERVNLMGYKISSEAVAAACWWNDDFIDLYVDKLMKKYPNYEASQVERQLRYRFELLAKNMKKMKPQPGLAPPKELMNVERRAKRRNTRLEKKRGDRVEVAEENLLEDIRLGVDNGWKDTNEALKLLGRCGMSSDESDATPGRKTELIVHDMYWRSEAVTTLLRWLDLKRRHTTVYGNEQSGPGQMERNRPSYAPRSSRKPKRGLPISFYRKEYIDSLRAAQLKALDPQAYRAIPVPPEMGA
ncbi:hypothetical protein ONZ45_g7943 [Pleurotus djamor]|nr:hypothetical protein ONZ45_g7943 [Pleurotus djamor]